uniref:Uncharacterized protein n=1 Tax=Rhizophora mucronata TaxID=61149 RepID=A0A2P2P3R8_RHIMU
MYRSTSLRPMSPFISVGFSSTHPRGCQSNNPILPNNLLRES